MTRCCRVSTACCYGSKPFPMLPGRPVEAKEKLDNAIEQAADAITEGRDAVQGLRDSTTQTNDLALAISTLGQELAADSTGHGPAFRVAAEGQSRDLHPILRDEVYKIAAEALRNAFLHANAKQVEAEFRYDDEQFRLRVRDDGKGIDAAVLSAQSRERHYGLPGNAGARHAHRRQADNMERSGRGNRSRIAPSRQHCLCVSSDGARGSHERSRPRQRA